MKHDMGSNCLNPKLHRPSVLVLALLFSLVLPGAAQQITSSATSASAKAVPKVANKEYVVGESDVLRINVWREPELSQPSIVVRPDGRISLPLIGEVKVSGMTPREIEAVLVERLQTTALKDARVTVTVVETGSKIVYVTGQCQAGGLSPSNADGCSANHCQGGRSYSICPQQGRVRFAPSRRRKAKVARKLCAGASRP